MSDIQNKIKAVMDVTIAVGDTIRELRQVPSGELYANVMSHLSLEEYQKVIETLKEIGVVREEPSHLLVWVGESCEKGVGL